ncbi:MAG TPA: hypothetical protein DEA08_20110 [Planctomycetes bacterium]|nr:hypothetical protein [Planctomycetota bacterium]
MNRHTLTITITTLCLSLGAAGCGGSEGAGHGSYGVPLTAPVRSAEAPERYPLVHRAASLPGGAAGVVADQAGGTALVLGGASASRAATPRAAELDLASGESRALAEGLVEPRSQFGLTRTADGWLAFGGRGAAGEDLSSCERYRFSTGRWEPVADTIPGLRGPLVAARVGRWTFAYARGSSQVLAFDAEDLGGELRAVELEEPLADAQLIMVDDEAELAFLYGGDTALWISLSEGLYLRYRGEDVPRGASAVRLPGAAGVLLVGGCDALGQPRNRLSLVRPLFPEPVDLGPLLPAVERPSAALLSDGTLFVAGGRVGGFASERAFRVDLASDEVEELAPLSEPREAAVLVTQLGGERVALIGGRGPAGPSAAIDLYGFLPYRETGAFLSAGQRRAARLAEEAELARLRAGLAATQSEIATLSAELGTRRAELADAEAEAARLRDELTTAQREQAAAEGRVSQLEQRRDALSAELAALEAQIAASQQRQSQVRQELAQAQRDLADAQSAQQTSMARHQALRDQLAQLQGQIAQLEAQVATLRPAAAQAQAQREAAERARRAAEEEAARQRAAEEAARQRAAQEAARAPQIDVIFTPDPELANRQPRTPANQIGAVTNLSNVRTTTTRTSSNPRGMQVGGVTNLFVRTR